jgi:uncharacterized protein
MDPIIAQLAEELDKDPRHVENVVRLLDEGNTIPFIARYRKELHGAMDDTSLRTLEERLAYLRGLQERRETVKSAIAEQGKLTEELSAAIDAAKTLAEVEDLTGPISKSAAPAATIAREKGLEPWQLCCLPRGRTARIPGRRQRIRGRGKGRGDGGGRPGRGVGHHCRVVSATTRSFAKSSGR